MSRICITRRVASDCERNRFTLSDCAGQLHELMLLLCIAHASRQQGVVAAAVSTRQGDRLSAARRVSWRLLCLAALVTCVGACSSAGSADPPASPPPVITQQPGSVSEPMGLSA